MVSPPVVTPNQFGIPNDEIRDYVNPIQRELAEEYGFEKLDLREEFEANPNFATEYLRPNNDNVHFTKAGAQYVAGRVWDIAKEFKL
jgi:lysophospholipase L1-like esterase